MPCLSRAIDEAVRSGFRDQPGMLEGLDATALRRYVSMLLAEPSKKPPCDGCTCFDGPVEARVPSPVVTPTHAPSTKRRTAAAADYDDINDFRCNCPDEGDDGPPRAKRCICTNQEKKWLFGKAYFACAKWQGDAARCGMWELESTVVEGRYQRPPRCNKHGVACIKQRVERPTSLYFNKEAYVCPMLANEDDPCVFARPIPEKKQPPPNTPRHSPYPGRGGSIGGRGPWHGLNGSGRGGRGGFVYQR
jgi:hypothetical protein